MGVRLAKTRIIVIGLDCATKTGWAIGTQKQIIESGVEDFSKRRGESNGMMFLRFRRWFYELIASLPEDNEKLIVYEAAHHRGGAATEIGVNLTGRVQELAAQTDINCMPVHTATLKKFVTGKGNAGKELMIAAAAVILGREPVDDNEADAVHIMRWGLNYVKGLFPSTS